MSPPARLANAVSQPFNSAVPNEPECSTPKTIDQRFQPNKATTPRVPVETTPGLMENMQWSPY
uniref:Uncharacterized protein n=1 Tax=Physcomitrium patens TaxID=3218 RepID=A0A7I3Z1N0_PHYPA